MQMFSSESTHAFKLVGYIVCLSVNLNVCLSLSLALSHGQSSIAVFTPYTRSARSVHISPITLGSRRRLGAHTCEQICSL